MRSFQSNAIPIPHLEPKAVQAINALFDSGKKSVDLEIGAGQGLHAIRYCSDNPDRTLIAVERTKNRHIQLLQRTCAHRHLCNLITVRADAVALTVHYIPPESLEKIFILYPNPYHKPKQANLRWHNRPFLGDLLKRLKPGGELTLATNLEWYAIEASEKLSAQWDLTQIEFSRRPISSSPRTHFESKYQARGEICWNLIYKKPTI